MDYFFSKEYEKHFAEGNRKGILFSFFVFLVVTFLDSQLDMAVNVVLIGVFYLGVTGLILSRYLECQTAVAGSTSLAEVIKYHAFDTETFFSKVAFRLAAASVSLALLGSICRLVKGEKEMIPFYFLFLVLPAAFYVVEKALFLYRMNHSVSVWLNVGLQLMKLCYAVYAILLFVGLLMGVIVGYGIFSDFVNRTNLPPTQVYYKAYVMSFMPVCIILLAILFAASFYHKFKYLRLVRLVLVILMVGTFVFSMIYGKFNYVLVTEDAIEYTRWNDTYVYSYDDVSSFHVYSKDGMGLRLTMKDGNKIEVVTDEYTNSDAWGEKYYSIYNFEADLVRRFLALGASGSMEEMDKIREHVASLDPQCIEGVETTIALLEQ